MTGRVVDALGKPAARAEVVVQLEQPGARAAPLRAATDCFGTFLTSFDLRDVSPDGEVTVTFKGHGAPDATATARLDPFYRRTDMKIRYEGEWPGAGCPEQTSLWPKRVSVTGRLVNRTPEYQEEGVAYHAKPYEGRVRVWYWPSPGEAICPPSSQTPGYCDTTAATVDERGDFRYSWVFNEPRALAANQTVEVVLEGKSVNFTIDPTFRMATAVHETTGQGPAHYDTPAPPLAVALLALVALALLRRR